MSEQNVDYSPLEKFEAEVQAFLDFSLIDDEIKEEITKEVETNFKMIRYHFMMVESTTGSITDEDVAYSANLVKRIISNKFNISYL
jgi:hypothetical protein